MVEKRALSFRLTPEARRLLAQLAKVLGISQTACIELALREMAKRRLK